MNRQRAARALLLACAVGAAAACKNDSDDHAGAVMVGPKRTPNEASGDGADADGGTDDSLPFVPRPSGSGSSPMPEGAGISELDSDQLADLCSELEARFDAQITRDEAARFGCTLLGILLSADVDADGVTTLDPADCQTETDRCLADRSGEASAVDCDGLELAARRCKLPLETFEACFDAQVERLAAALDGLACDALDSPDAIERALALGNAGALPECEQVADECPALLPSSVDESAIMAASSPGCSNTCSTARDDRCDDGGDGSTTDACELGSDCTDCGPR